MKRSALLSFVACTAIGLHAADTNTMFRLNTYSTNLPVKVFCGPDARLEKINLSDYGI